MANRKPVKRPLGQAEEGTVEKRRRVRGRSRPAGGLADALVEPMLRGEAPDWLVRSAIFRKVPPAERARLDRAILLPGKRQRSVEAVAAEFKLVDTYGISVAALKTYAGKLEQLVRPLVTSQVLAGVLGCLPAAYRRKLIKGSEVVLISKVLDAMSSAESPLNVAELAKVASVLATLAKQRTNPGSAGSRSAARDGAPTASGQSAQPSPEDPAKLAESVRLLYGLPWPVDGSGQLPGVEPNDSDGPVRNDLSGCTGPKGEGSVHVHLEGSPI